MAAAAPEHTRTPHCGVEIASGRTTALAMTVFSSGAIPGLPALIDTGDCVALPAGPGAGEGGQGLHLVTARPAGCQVIRTLL